MFWLLKLNYFFVKIKWACNFTYKTQYWLDRSVICSHTNAFKGDKTFYKSEKKIWKSSLGIRRLDSAFRQTSFILLITRKDGRAPNFKHISAQLTSKTRIPHTWSLMLDKNAQLLQNLHHRVFVLGTAFRRCISLSGILNGRW